MITAFFAGVRFNPITRITPSYPVSWGRVKPLHDNSEWSKSASEIEESLGSFWSFFVYFV
jgi:hypothetical protein